jgi:hypothetical protein
MKNGVFRLAYYLSQEGIRMRNQPYLVIELYSKVIVIKPRQALYESRVQVKLRLIQ